MNIQREAFLGGERYVCRDCGIVVEENHYPVTEVYTSAKAKGLVKQVHFIPQCNCEDDKEEEDSSRV